MVGRKSLLKDDILGEVETAAILRRRTRPDPKSPAQIEVMNKLIEDLWVFHLFQTVSRGLRYLVLEARKADRW